MKIFVVGLFVLLGVALAAFLFMAYQSRGGSAPGISDGALSPCKPSPNCVSSSAAPDTMQNIAAFALAPDGHEAFLDKLTNAITSTGGIVVRREQGYLAATFSSKLFGFVDDFECLIDDEQQQAHVRSAARVGHSDFGVNRKRVEQIREVLRRE